MQQTIIENVILIRLLVFKLTIDHVLTLIYVLHSVTNVSKLGSISTIIDFQVTSDFIRGYSCRGRNITNSFFRSKPLNYHPETGLKLLHS